MPELDARRVDDQHVEIVRGRHDQAVLAVIGMRCVMPRFRQRLDDISGDIGVVFDDQNAHEADRFPLFQQYVEAQSAVSQVSAD